MAAPYATLEGAQQRLYEAGTPVPTIEAPLVQSLCDDVNSWIESKTQRVLAPVTPYASTLIGAASAGATSVDVASADDLAVGDDILLGLLSGNHENLNVIVIGASSLAPYTTWTAATVYAPGAKVIPTTPNGHVYENTGTSGTSGMSEPVFPTNGGTVVDGANIIWDDLGVESFPVTFGSALVYAHADDTPLQTIIVQDGFAAVDDGLSLVYDRGLITLAAVETAPYTGGPWGPVLGGDFFLRPTPVDPGWPFTEVLLTNVPHPSSTYPVFYPGYGNIRLIGPGPCTGMDLVPFQGFPAIPDAIRDVALKCVVVGFRGRTTGGTDTQIINLADGSRSYESMLSYTDRMTLDRYRAKVVGIIDSSPV